MFLSCQNYEININTDWTCLLSLIDSRLKDIPNLSLWLKRQILSHVIVKKILHIKYSHIHFIDVNMFLNNMIMITLCFSFFVFSLFENISWVTYYKPSNFSTRWLGNLDRETIFRFLDLNTRTFYSFSYEGLNHFSSYWKIRNLNWLPIRSWNETINRDWYKSEYFNYFWDNVKNKYCISKSNNSEINYNLSIRSVVFLHKIVYYLIALLPDERMKIWILISNIGVFPIFWKGISPVFRKEFNECV